jgi:hypothetical protein
MRLRKFKALFFVATVSLPLRALAEDANAPIAATPTHTNQAWVADEKTVAHIRDIVASTQGADGVFVVGDDGSVKHVQSGVVCPAKFPNVDFWHAEIFQSALGAGMDVGCDYGRNGSDGNWISKLTIFATKAPEGMTLDQAFAKDRNEVVQVAPNAVSLGEAVKEENKPATEPDIRSEEFSETRGGRGFISDLLVTLKDGWIFELRATYPGETGTAVIPKDATPEEASLIVGDYAMLSMAFTRVVLTK